MTELKAFLTSLYDALSEAEMQALQHGQVRLAELLEAGAVPQDVAVPVYHASDVEVTLDVGLRAEQTEEGTEMFVTEATDDASALTFTVDLFELIEKRDLEDLDYDGIVSGPGGGTWPTPNADDARERAENETTRGTDDRDRKPSVDDPRDPPIDVIDGIEPRHRERLAASGIERLTDLVDRSPQEVAETIDDDDADEVSPERAADWLEEARGLATVLADHDDAFPVELVDGIGPTFGSRLRDSGVAELSALVDLSPEELSTMVSTEETTVSPERAATWLEEANARLRALDDRGDDANATNATDDTETDR